MKLEHIGIAVKSIDGQLKVWQDLFGFKVEFDGEVADQGVRVSVLDVGGTKVELIEPIDMHCSVQRFIEKRGEGLHHLSFEVEDLAKMIGDLKERGIRMIDEVPRKGTRGSSIAFVHPVSTGGVLIELCQMAKKDQEE